MSAFRLVPLQRLEWAMKMSWAADKGMQSDIPQSMPLPMAGSPLFDTVWGGLPAKAAHCTELNTPCPLGTHLEETPDCRRPNLAYSKASSSLFSGQISLLKLPKQMDLSSNMVPAERLREPESTHKIKSIPLDKGGGKAPALSKSSPMTPWALKVAKWSL